jgi:hypothetical protein
MRYSHTPLWLLITSILLLPAIRARAEVPALRPAGPPPAAPGPRRAPEPAGSLALDPLPRSPKDRAVVALTTTANLVVAATADGRLRAWDPVSRKALWQVEAPLPVTDLARSGDGKTLLVTVKNLTNLTYPLTPAAPVSPWKFKRKTGSTQGLSPDGRLIVRADVRDSVRGYELQGYKMKWLVKAARVAVSLDGTMAACVLGKAVTVVDTQRGKPQGPAREAGGEVIAFAVHAPSRLALLTRSGEQCHLTVGDRPARVVPCPATAELRFSPRGDLLALSTPGSGQVLDGATGAPRAEHRATAAPGFVRIAPLSETSYVVAGGSPDGSLSLFRLPAVAPSPSRPGPRPVASLAGASRRSR